MQECPYCGSELRGTSTEIKTRSGAPGSASTPGRKDTGASLVSCPDCDGVIDGYSPH